MANITFTNVTGMDYLEIPKPASLYIPDWYKNMESYMNGTKVPDNTGTTQATIKKCIPVFDAITSGYIIVTIHDMYVDIVDGKQKVISAPISPLESHPIEQAPTHPMKKDIPYLKWINPWAIKTEPGYSILFTQPFHRESPISILPGVVDTDTYIAPVNFPFVINDSSFTGLIPSGTPIVQIIPFKREKWKSLKGKQKELVKIKNNTNFLNSKFVNRYKTMFWSRKEYK
jgi:hypothetical protein